MQAKTIKDIPAPKFKVGGYVWAYVQPHIITEESDPVFECQITKITLGVIDRGREDLQFRYDYELELNTMFRDTVSREEADVYATEQAALDFAIPTMARKVKVSRLALHRVQGALFNLKDREKEVRTPIKESPNV